MSKYIIDYLNDIDETLLEEALCIPDQPYEMVIDNSRSHIRACMITASVAVVIVAAVIAVMSVRGGFTTNESGESDSIVSESFAGNEKFADYIETDLSEFEKNNGLHNALESGLGTFCGHIQEYHSVSSFLNEISGNGKTISEYVKAQGSGSCKVNIVDFVKFADISKEDYIAGINKHYADNKENKIDNSERREKLLADIEIIYCGDETKINNYFNNNDGSHDPTEEEKDLSKNFFIIHGALMRYVGVEKYHPYLEYVYGSKYDNIKNFIEYFKIDRITFEEIMKTAEASDFYNIDDLF